MVAMEGSWQEFLMKTKALVPDAQAFPLSKDFPAVRLPAVSSASVGPACARCAMLIIAMRCACWAMRWHTPWAACTIPYRPESAC